MYRFKTLSQHLIISEDKSKETITVSLDLENNPNLGKFFIYGKIKTSDSNLRHFFEALFGLAKTYYQNSTASDSETALEEILKKLNGEWQGGLSKNSLNGHGSDLRQKLQNIALTIGILEEGELYLASVGPAHLFLTRDNKMLDILDSNDDVRIADMSKLFTNIISGKLKENDILFFCFGDFLDYFSLEKIKRIVQDYPPDKACQYFSDLLHPIEHHKVFIVNILKLLLRKSNELLPARPSPVRSDASQSMDDLNNQQADTDRVMNPSSFPEALKPEVLRNKIKKASTTLFEFITFKKYFAEHPLAWENSLRNWLKKISQLFNRPAKITSGLGQAGTIEASPESTPKKDLHLTLVTHRGRVYLFIFIGVILILGLGIFFTIKAQANRKLTNDYNSIIQQIEEKNGLAQAALIYKNNASATDLFNEIDTLLARLPQNTGTRQQKYQELKQANQQQLDSLLKLYVINDATALLEYSSFNADFRAIGGILSPENQIYFWDNQTIYLGNAQTKQAELLTKLENDTITAGTWWSPGRLAFITQSQKLAVLDIANKQWEILTINSNHQPVSGLDLKIYNDRLYLLDSNGQIYKYTRGSTGYENETAWLSGGTRLNLAKQLSIDSALWLLADNKVQKFYQGKADSWTAEIEPAINDPRWLLTSADLKQLYVFDATDRRLVILTKAGQIIKQYRNSQWQNVVALGADEKNNQAFIFATDKIYLVNWK